MMIQVGSRAPKLLGLEVWNGTTSFCEMETSLEKMEKTYV
jgi:hypothetical protein